MTQYVVLKQGQETTEWDVFATIDAPNSDLAVTKVASEDGSYVAVATRHFSPVTVQTQSKVQVKILKADAAPVEEVPAA